MKLTSLSNFVIRKRNFKEAVLLLIQLDVKVTWFTKVYYEQVSVGSRLSMILTSN